MNHYKSWSSLKKQLTECLCEPLKGRITYFFTHYHEVHNAYGRAAIRFDDREIAVFEWSANTEQEADVAKSGAATGDYGYENPERKKKWAEGCVYSEMDFLSAASSFLQLAIADALHSENYLIKILAIMDRRVGKRTLERIRKDAEFLTYPEWVQQFYRLRLGLTK